MPTFTGTSGSDTLDGTALSDIIDGLAGNDILRGFAGDDILDGGLGEDVMRGGAGDDRYYVDDSSDAAIENSGEGIDTVYSSVSYRLRDNVENLNLTGSAVRAVGNSGANRLVGTSGNNILDGAAGADIMRGGLGNDRYYVDDTGDQAIENASEGIDTVFSSVNYRLRENVENLTLTGSAIRAVGNSGANRLVGTSANNVLDGAGGADLMMGGSGADIYYVDHVADQVIEETDAQSDRVYSTVTFTLGDHVEQLFLRGSAAISGTGNELANRIVGNGANNTLNGRAGDDILIGGGGNDTLNGGGGNDTMSGGTGNDIYYVNSLFDIVTEAGGEGVDLIRLQLGADYFFDIPDNVENLVVSDNARSAVRGNSLGNVITGGTDSDYLIGMGGDDVIRGGGGPGDSMYGGDGQDQLIGGSGNDTMGGGLGVDTLTSGDGVDAFSYSDAAESTPDGWDTITDFTSDPTSNPADYLDLRSVDANQNADGNQTFAIADGAAAYSIWLTSTANLDGSSEWVVYGDVNGDTTPELEIHIHVLGSTLYANDILL